MASPPPSSPPQDSPPPPPSPPQAIPLALALPAVRQAIPSPEKPLQTPPPANSQPTPAKNPPSSSSRRLPPPCWSPDETIALIDAYRDKWYSLRRGNLKATHWQDVADAVAERCPVASPPKTAVQCRHKMEKLRKRYRTELQRARSVPVARFNSSWVHFKRMDAMERGPSPPPNPNPRPDPDQISDNSENSDDDADQQLYEELKFGSNSKSANNMYRNGGFRIRIPTGVSIAQPGTASVYAKVDPKFAAPMGFGSSKVVRECGSGVKREREKDPVTEMVAAIKALGDGFVRMEQMKMEMAREIETKRMEMEMKRTEMFLDSQQRIVEAFSEAISEKKKKKPKRMPSPPEN